MVKIMVKILNVNTIYVTVDTIQKTNYRNTKEKSTCYIIVEIVIIFLMDINDIDDTQ